MLRTILLNGIVRPLGTRPILSTATIGVFSGLIRPLISLITIPALLASLGTEGLGVWIIALSVIAIIGFINGGLSAATVTAVGRACASGEIGDLSREVTSGFVLTLAASLAALIVALPIALLVDWHSLLKLSDAFSPFEIKAVFVVIALALAIGFPANLPRFVMMGRQHGYATHLLDLASLITAAGVLLCFIFLNKPMWLLAAVFLGTQYACLWLGGIVYMHRAGILFTSPHHFDRVRFRALAADGGRLALYQAAYAVSSSSDSLLIGMIFGAPASAVYGIVQRVFSLPVSAMASLNYALWPAMAKADAEGRPEWVRRAFIKTLAILVPLALASGVVLVMIFDPLTKFWLGQTVDASPLLLFGMVAWLLVSTAVVTAETVLRARGEARFMVRAMVVMMLINLPLSVALLHAVGPAGAIWGSVIAFTFGLLLPYLWRCFHVLGRPDACASPPLP